MLHKLTNWKIGETKEKEPAIKRNNYELISCN